MISFRIFLAIFAAVTVTVGAVARIQMEPDISVFSSKRWIQLTQPPAAGATISATFALKRSSDKSAKIEETLMDLSTPTSNNYGKWLSKEQVKELVAASEEQLKTVTDFVESYGVTEFRISEFKDMVQVKMPVNVAETMLQTEFASFRSALLKDVVILRVTKPYYLPANVAEVVALVDNIVRFPSVDRKQIDLPTTTADSEFSSCGAPCNGFTTPAVLESAYSYSRLNKYTPGNSVAVAEFQYQYYDNTDLEAFSQACDVKVTVAETIGGNKEFICTGIGGCVEALLDIEFIGAVTNPIPLTVIYQADYSLLDWVNSVIAMDNPPLVHSVSYGNDEVQQTSSQYMETCNTQFQVAGAMGLTIVFAAGDMGVWGRTGVGKTFHPDFPAGSPYVTAVGGTDFQHKSTIGNETTWSCGGGGFSDEFATPSWQAAQVQGYLTAAGAAGALPDSSKYNANGRGYPDISALGGQVNPYCVAIKGGDFAGVAGTSASAPVVAGVIALLNDLRLSKGQAPLGFINPWLYSVAGPAGCFNDINDGSKNNCYANSDGFAALAGWDPATGFGSPNVACLSGIV